MSVNESEVRSLVYLLEDPDPSVQDGIKSRFLELGEQIIPMLDRFKNETNAEHERTSIREVMYELTLHSVLEDFTDLIQRGVTSREELEDALLLISRLEEPTLRTGEYKRKLDQFAREIGPEISYNPSLEEKMKILLRYVFKELRFRGDAKNYHNSDNAYLHRVIDRRKGLPIMLSMVVIFLARRLHLPFYGVNMPIHFMLMYQRPGGNILIDPFDAGRIVSTDQCYYFLKRNSIDPRPEHLIRATELQILARCIRNLMHSYAKKDQMERAQDLQIMLDLTERAEETSK
ncbi:MAG: hypothetical protein DA446_01490 [Bacteroidetes bacterium]|nr:MAG: hypothetical protein DA443_00305 [Bacteroidota bacterium]PTM20730.1 MAG: hypothetical protein DA446_01490 [Bacteroidota bacterium]